MNNIVLALSHDGRALAICNAEKASGLVDLDTLQTRPLPVDSQSRRSHGVFAGRSTAGRRQQLDRARDRLRRVQAGANDATCRAGAGDDLFTDARTLATAVTGGGVALWHTATGQQVVAFDNLSGEAIAIRFSRDGNSLAALVDVPEQQASEIYVWSAASK